MNTLISAKCPNCHGPVPIEHPKKTYSFECPHCGSPIIWVSEFESSSDRIGHLTQNINYNIYPETKFKEVEIMKEERKETIQTLLIVLVIIIFIVGIGVLFWFIL